MNNDKQQYNAADIQRYLNGQMPVGEMNALEKAAMEDPFLADAIEGYGNNAGWEDGELDDLKARHKKRTASTQKTIVPFYRSQWWQIAATVLVLAGSGTLIYYLAANTESTIVAKNKVEELKVDAPDSTTAAGSRIAETASPSSDKSQDMQTLAAPSKKQEALKKPVNPGPSPEAASAVMDEVATKPVRIPEEKDSAKDIATENRLVTKTDSLYTGAVASRRSDGYADNTRQVEPVTSASPFPRQKTFTTQDALPINGPDSFVKYIEKNKRIPDSLKNVHGELVVSFLVGKDGKLTEFNIEKSLNKQLDDEAIRLITEGPPWKVLKDRKAKAVVTIQF